MECPKRETTKAEHPIPENAPTGNAPTENAPTEEDSKYPRGIPLFLNLLSIILATIVCGYVCAACHAMLFNLVFANIKNRMRIV